MTNEEIATEIKEKDVCKVWNGGCQYVYHAAMEMAEIKDKAHKDECDAINARVEDTTRQMKALNDLIESKNAKLKSAYQENSKLCQTIITYEQKIISLKYDVEETEGKQHKAEKELEEWKGVYIRQNSRLNEDNKDLQRKLSAAHTEINKHKKELESLKKEYYDLLGL